MAISGVLCVGPSVCVYHHCLLQVYECWWSTVQPVQVAVRWYHMHNCVQDEVEQVWEEHIGFHRTHSCNASVGDDSVVGEALGTALVGLGSQQIREETFTHDGAPLPLEEQTIAVTASRQHTPPTATVVPAQYFCPFAASSLQARTPTQV